LWLNNTFTRKLTALKKYGEWGDGEALEAGEKVKGKREKE
jgi:hypothetical protein